MGIEVDNITSDIQTTATTTSSTTSVSGPKTFMFGKKTGFVIPKNKLSGSLVPVCRPTKRGDGESVNEEAPVQLQRKTKWGPDPTLDTTVRKGRVLAYQTRINQISEQLTFGALAINDNQDPLSMPEANDQKSSNHQPSIEETQLLELERREIIGEILKLNPSYKAPASYKPLLKEEKVPIPIKEYPGYNFIGLLFGPASDTLKRLEKETGSKIRVYGIKADTGGKVEITPSDGKETIDAYEDLYVHVLADSFGKVDAAVALIELFVTPVSMNPVSVSSTSTSVPDENSNAQPSQNTPNSISTPSLLSQGTPQPYTGSFQPPRWFHAQNTSYPQSGSLTPTISSGALHNNPTPLSSSPLNPSNTPSLFNPRPSQPTSFTPVMQNPSLVHSSPLPPNTLPPQYIQQPPMPGQTGGPRNPQLSLTGPRPIMSTFQGPPTNFNATTQVLSPGHNRPPPLNVPNNMISSVSGPFHSSGASPGQQFQGGFPRSPLGPLQPAMPGMHAPGPNFVPGPNYFSGNAPNSLSPAIPRPSSSDFTFQPHRPPYSASPAAWQNNQTGQGCLAPQPPPSVRPMIHNFESHQPPRPQMNQLRAQILNFGGNPLGPPRHPSFPGPNGAGSPNMQPRNSIPSYPVGNPTSPFPPRQGNNQMQPQQNYRPFGATRPPQMFSGPRQHFGNRPFGGASGVKQVYDPFSPSSASFNPQMGNNNAAKGRDESDPEYDDLMASVGVK